MSEPVTYSLEAGVATLTLDDGRVNALSIPNLEALHGAFGRAERDAAVVLLRGRGELFSAGFDLTVLQRGGESAMREMVHLGATLAERILAFPAPVVVACTGHAYPAGAFLMLSADRRIGARGDFRIGLNEVAIGLTVPLFAVELARHRLTPAHFHRITTGDMIAPEEAVQAGFLDELVPAADLHERAGEVAFGLTRIDRKAHTATKERVRARVLRDVRAAIGAELTA